MHVPANPTSMLAPSIYDHTDGTTDFTGDSPSPAVVATDFAGDSPSPAAVEAVLLTLRFLCTFWIPGSSLPIAR